MRELPVYTGGEAAIRFSLAPVSPTLEHFNKMVELSLKTFMKSFPRLFATKESYMTRGVQILKTKRRKHKPGFKVVIQWA